VQGEGSKGKIRYDCAERQSLKLACHPEGEKELGNKRGERKGFRLGKTILDHLPRTANQEGKGGSLTHEREKSAHRKCSGPAQRNDQSVTRTWEREIGPGERSRRKTKMSPEGIDREFLNQEKSVLRATYPLV